MTQIETKQPVYGPKGQPFAVEIDGLTVWTWTEDEAWDLRDAALDAGKSVSIRGLPFRGATNL